MRPACHPAGQHAGMSMSRENDATPVLVSARTRLRPVVPDDAATLRAITETPAVARWWHPSGPDFPFDFDPDTVRWVVEIAHAPDIGAVGAVVGMIQAYEGDNPDYDECGIDVFLAPSVHRRGLGAEMVTRPRLAGRGPRAPPRDDRPGVVEQRGHRVLPGVRVRAGRHPARPRARHPRHRLARHPADGLQRLDLTTWRVMTWAGAGARVDVMTRGGVTRR